MMTNVPPPKSVLIVRLSAIGDVIHALPVLDALRRTLPDARLGWVVEELSAPLLENHPQLDVLHAIPRRRWRGKSLLKNWRTEVLPTFRRIRAERWDVALDLQGLTKSGLVAWGCGAARRCGFAGEDSRELNGLLIGERMAPPESARHVVQRNLSLLRLLGVEAPEDSRGRIGLRPEEIEAMAARLKDAGADGRPLVGLNPAAGWVTKRWPPENFARLGQFIAKATDAQPVVLWGPGEEALRDAVLAGLGHTGAFAAPATTVRESAALAPNLAALVGLDTGFSHLAGMLGIPVVTIFGASDPNRNAPWPLVEERNAFATWSPVSQRGDLECVPCWQRKCPFHGERKLQCLRELPAEAVWEMHEEYLKAAILEYLRHH